MHIAQAEIDEAKALIPVQDFASVEFDRNFGRKPTHALFIWSTPRSGSTFLCDLLYRSNFCLPHEYFQPYQYLPLLADRWNCINADRELVEYKYIESLFRFRTWENGFVGLNLHGEHLKTFVKFEQYFANLECEHIHLIRKNQIRQSVSFEIAHQAKMWSTHYSSGTEPEYNYDSLLRRLQIIHLNNTLISSYLESRSLPSIKMYYEDLVKDPAEQLKPILPAKTILEAKERTTVRKQSDSRNDEWTARFINEIVDRACMPIPPTQT